MSAAAKPAPHPMIATFAIAAMSLLVGGVLEGIGILRVLDEAFAGWADGLALGGRLVPLDMAWVWGWTVAATLGMAWAVLHVAQGWQRGVVVFSTLVLTLAWAPVLILAGRLPAPGVPLVALVWVSAGALVYAARHANPE